MNLSGLSYVQFLLVDAFVAIYLFIRIHETGSWAGINPIAALRRNRNGELARLLGFYCCVAASALAIAKDAIMSGQELDDVNLCRESIYTRRPVTPLDAVQLPGIKTGLLLWDVSSGFHLLALGCMLSFWASSMPLRHILGKDGFMNSTARKLMLAWGGAGLVVAIAVHFGVHQGDETARARSISRLATSALFFVTLALLVWVILRVGRILRQQANRPLNTIHHVLSTQLLAFMNDSAQLLAVVLFVRSLPLLTFDISYLSPAQTIGQSLASSSMLLGIGTLASSLVSACIVNVMFPLRLGILGDALSKVSSSGNGEKDQVARLAFFDELSHHHHGHLPSNMGGQVSHLEPSLTLNGTNHGSSRKSRSRAPTAASLAVEKLMPRSTSRDNNSNSNAKLDQSFTTHGGDDIDDVTNYLEHIPYIDRNARENSYFAMGPWTQPVTKVLTPHTSLSPNGPIGIVTSLSSSPATQSLQRIDPQARANVESTIMSPEDRRTSVFSDQDGSVLGYMDQQQQQQLANASWVSRRSQVISSYVPLSSSNLALAPSIAGLNGSGLSNSALTSGSHPSGPSLHAEPLGDTQAEGSRPDSIISSYIRPDNRLPMFRNVLKSERKSSFASDDYQYEPSGGPQHLSRNNPFEANSSPLALRPIQTAATAAAATAEKTPVYIASPVPSDAANGSEEADDGLGSNSKMQEGVGPVLIHKGSKASLRRKNTVERLKRFDAKDSPAMDQQLSVDNSANSSQSSVRANSNSNNNSNSGADGGRDDGSPMTVADAKLVLKRSRMSAFTSKVVTPPAVADSSHSQHLPLEPSRDSSTISTISWGNRSKHGSEILARGVDAQGMASTRLQQHFQNGALPPTSPVASFKHSLSSIHSYQDSNDVFLSLSSLNTTGANDSFYTPESSIAQQLNEQNVSPELRPSTAPSLSRNQQRHTLAVSEKTGPTPANELMTDAAAATMPVESKLLSGILPKPPTEEQVESLFNI
ncbi:hypothetical protein GGF42_001621 [Coemansia sp. RSA 2424]|nr:hypothetical protein GGF42_001621 [Coemansia sp. RSA 2424]